MTIGDIIKGRRKEYDMTQEDLAKAVGTTKATVSRWESGDIRKMKRDMAAKLANTLHLDPYLLLPQDNVLTPEESKVIEAYRKADDGTRASVRKLLDVPETKKGQESSAG